MSIPMSPAQIDLLDETRDLTLAALLGVEVRLDAQEGTPDRERIQLVSTFRRGDMFTGALMAMQILCQNYGTTLAERARRLAERAEAGPVADAVQLVLDAIHPDSTVAPMVVHDPDRALALVLLLLTSELEAEADSLGISARDMLARTRLEVLRATVVGAPGEEIVVIH